MVTDADVLPRHGFTQMARNMRCQLYFPFPTEQVVLLRTGLLVHINAYMRSLGFSPHPHQPGPAAPSPHTDAQTDIAADREGGGGVGAPQSLKAHMASNASAGLHDKQTQGSGASSLCDAMDVDSSAGDLMNVRLLASASPGAIITVGWFH